MATQSQQHSNDSGIFGALNRGLAKLFREPHSPYMLGDVSPSRKEFPYSPGQYVNWGTGARDLFSAPEAINYELAAGDLMNSSIVMACLNWAIRTFPQVPMSVVRQEKGGDVVIPNHPLRELLAHPNTHYSGRDLWKPTLISLNIDGDAYWRKIRNDAKRVIRLYYEPHWNMRPVRASAEDFVSYYEIYRDHRWWRIETSEVVHFRNGIDPYNDMRGLSPLRAALRAVATDNQATEFVYTLLKRMGIVSVILSPDGDFEFKDKEAVKRQYIEKTTGANRGDPMVSDVPMKAMYPPFDPGKWNTRELSLTPEERVAALIGIPAVVAQLGAGLIRSTFANFDAAVEMAWMSNLIPSMLVLADTLDLQLLPEFGDETVEDIVWDLSDVRVLQGNELERATATEILLRSDAIKRSEARIRHDYPVEPGDEFYLSELAKMSAEQVVAAKSKSSGYALHGEVIPPALSPKRRALVAGKDGLYTRQLSTRLYGTPYALLSLPAVEVKASRNGHEKELVKVGEGA